MSFYLTDSQTGAVLAPPLVVHLKNASGTITAAQNPVPLVPGTPYGQTSISWSAPSASATEIRIGSPAGPLFAAGTSSGSATTGAWVTDGLTLYLQDATNGTSTSPNSTLGTLTLQLQKNTAASLTITPNPIVLAAGATYGKATLNWSAPNSSKVEVHVTSATGPLFAAGGSTGSATTGNWITNGMQFVLVDATSKAQLASATAQVQ
jgi:hypothetical protein